MCSEFWGKKGTARVFYRPVCKLKNRVFLVTFRVCKIVHIKRIATKLSRHMKAIRNNVPAKLEDDWCFRTGDIDEKPLDQSDWSKVPHRPGPIFPVPKMVG